MSKSKEELIEEKIKNEKEIEILEHQKQRLENRIEYLTKGDRAKRTHRLCEKGGAIESVCPETKDIPVRSKTSGDWQIQKKTG